MIPPCTTIKLEPSTLFLSIVNWSTYVPMSNSSNSRLTFLSISQTSGIMLSTGIILLLTTALFLVSLFLLLLALSSVPILVLFWRTSLLLMGLLNFILLQSWLVGNELSLKDLTSTTSNSLSLSSQTKTIFYNHHLQGYYLLHHVNKSVILFIIKKASD